MNQCNGQPWRDALTRDEDRHLAELLELLRIPSVSTDPDRKGDVRATAERVADRLRAAGVPEVLMAESAGHPAVIADWPADPAQPTVLVYGHYSEFTARQDFSRCGSSREISSARRWLRWAGETI